MKKNELEKARSEYLKVAEEELIDRAKRDAELNEIDDEDVRNKIQDEINQLRKERDSIREELNENSELQDTEISIDEEEIIKYISINGGHISEGNIIINSKHDKVKTEYYLENLKAKGYLKKSYESHPANDYVHDLTTKAKKLAIDRGFVV